MIHTGVVMVRCPATSRELSTGVEMDAATFERLPDIRSRMSCPVCNLDHDWSTRDAWLGNPAPSAPASLSSEAQPWGFTTALFEFYWGRCGVIGATCSGTVAFAHTPALLGSDDCNPDQICTTARFSCRKPHQGQPQASLDSQQRTHSKHRMPRVPTEDNGSYDFLRGELNECG